MILEIICMPNGKRKQMQKAFWARMFFQLDLVLLPEISICFFNLKVPLKKPGEGLGAVAQPLIPALQAALQAALPFSPKQLRGSCFRQLSVAGQPS